jgi:hypothetical protein
VHAEAEERVFVIENELRSDYLKKLGTARQQHSK